MRGIANELLLPFVVLLGTLNGAAGALCQLLELGYVCAHGQVVHSVAQVVAV